MKSYIKSISLQLILAFVAVISWLNCKKLGFNTASGEVFNYQTEEFEPLPTIDAGYNGGAIAMGIICSVCILMIVWIEINKHSKS